MRIRCTTNCTLCDCAARFPYVASHSANRPKVAEYGHLFTRQGGHAGVAIVLSGVAQYVIVDDLSRSGSTGSPQRGARRLRLLDYRLEADAYQLQRSGCIWRCDDHVVCYGECGRMFGDLSSASSLWRLFPAISITMILRTNRSPSDC